MDADKLRDKLTKLHGLLGSDNASEHEAARAKIMELLAKNKKTWNDLTELLRTGNSQGWQDDDGLATATSGDPHPPPLDLICRVLQRHLHLTDRQFVALTLWIAHTFRFHDFSVTPRLALVSPVIIAMENSPTTSTVTRRRHRPQAGSMVDIGNAPRGSSSCRAPIAWPRRVGLRPCLRARRRDRRHPWSAMSAAMKPIRVSFFITCSIFEISAPRRCRQFL